MGTAIPEEEFRASVLLACRRIIKQGKSITRGTLRAYGARGDEVRMLDFTQELAKQGKIPLAAYNQGRNCRRALEVNRETLTSAWSEIMTAPCAVSSVAAEPAKSAPGDVANRLRPAMTRNAC